MTPLSPIFKQMPNKRKCNNNIWERSHSIQIISGVFSGVAFVNIRGFLFLQKHSGILRGFEDFRDKCPTCVKGASGDKFPEISGTYPRDQEELLTCKSSQPVYIQTFSMMTDKIFGGQLFSTDKNSTD